MTPVKEKYVAAIDGLKEKLGSSNVNSLPKLEKVVISVGMGKHNKDKRRLEVVMDRLAKISGQKPTARPAKKSIATFKLREGDTIGAAVTLRGARMFAFLDRLINVAIPRTRDFRGIKRSGIDSIGNLTMGFTEHTMFPETADEDLQDIFGFSVTLVTTAKDKESATALFEAIGIPFAEEKK